MTKLRVLDLFSGIGGFSLGLERTGGFETVAFCEIEPYPQKVLAKHWPGVPIYDDVRELTAGRLGGDGIAVDVITGGYPCQPFSLAGDRGGQEDDRHLWPEVNRLIREIRPRWVICENVYGHISMGLDEVLSDLEGLGYTAEAFVIPACAAGLGHRRDRVWIVAYPELYSVQGGTVTAAQGHNKPNEEQLAGFLFTGAEPSLSGARSCGSAYGVSSGVDISKRNRAIGNAVVPQIPELIGRAILEATA